MNPPEQRFYDTYIGPLQNGPALKLLLFLALDCASGKRLTRSYQDLAERVGLDRSTLIHAVKRLHVFPNSDVPPVLERLQKGRGRKPSSYAVHLPGLRLREPML